MHGVTHYGKEIIGSQDKTTKNTEREREREIVGVSMGDAINRSEQTIFPFL